MQLSDINFPVYKLGTIKPIVEDKVIFYVTNNCTIEVVDDLTQSAKTLGLRRLAISAQGAKLAKLHTAIFFIGDLLRLTRPGTWFIDSSGKLFQYTKKTKVPLVCKKITKILVVPGASIIEVEGLSNRFMSLFRPTTNQKYAGLLRIGNGYILYGYYGSKFKDTYRSI